MSLGQAVALGIIQGLTEFLPISSSAHLFVVPTLLGWPYHGLGFDVALHWGTLIALLVAFWRDWWRLLRDFFSADRLARDDARRTWLQLAVGSVPAAIAGLLFKDVIETQLRWLPLQAVTLSVFGFLLWWVDRKAPTRVSETSPSWGAALLMGCAQAVALVPGVSRSGVTITAGRAAGLPRVAAARFSFLLATPITFGAGLLEVEHFRDSASTQVLIVGMAVSAVVGILAIRGLLHWLGRAGFGVFFAYRLALAALVLMSAARS
jgi:undecaprenyl-diphosphatase